jgi:hypothetical protein
MLNLTQEERDAVVEWLFDSDVSFLVQAIMDLMPEEDLKDLALRLTGGEEDEGIQILEAR